MAPCYDAWIAKRGDMSDVPLAPDLRFPGPVADFDDADSYRAMAREAGATMVTSFTVRQQFTDGNTVCSIIDWQMALPAAPMTSAEIRPATEAPSGAALAPPAQRARNRRGRPPAVPDARLGELAAPGPEAIYHVRESSAPRS